MTKQSVRRLAENEVIFREANKDAEAFLRDTGAASSTTLPFFCECSDVNCRGRIEISAEEYDQLHKSKQYFIVLDGHEIPQIERVVARKDGFNVVAKLGDLPDDKDINVALKRLAF